LVDEFTEYLEKQVKELQQLSLKANPANLRPIYRKKLRIVQEKVLPAAQKLLKGETLSRRDVLNAMSITCFGNLAYCCGLEKECPWRDMARAALRIDDETFKSKEEWIWSILKIEG